MAAVFGKKMVFLVLIAVILTMTVGGFYTAEMMTMDGGMMHNCPFMGVPALCNMTPLAHLAEWQNMFSTTVQQMTLISLLLLLAFAVVWHFVRDLFVPKRTEVFIPRYREAEHIFDPLKLAFARGLIHPKVF